MHRSSTSAKCGAPSHYRLLVIIDEMTSSPFSHQFSM